MFDFGNMFSWFGASALALGGAALMDLGNGFSFAMSEDAPSEFAWVTTAYDDGKTTLYSDIAMDDSSGQTHFSTRRLNNETGEFYDYGSIYVDENLDAYMRDPASGNDVRVGYNRFEGNDSVVYKCVQGLVDSSGNCVGHEISRHTIFNKTGPQFVSSGGTQ